MSNLIRVTNGDEMSRIVSTSEHRLIVVMYISKTRDCLSALAALEKSSQVHRLALFCVVDIDTFVGDCIYLPYLKDVNTVPRLECLYGLKSMGTMANIIDSKVEEVVIRGEEYIAKQAQTHYGNSFQEQQPGLPTLKQMQYMFNVFQLMQQMGLLKPVTPTSDNVITLENGEKVIPLPDGRFKLIRPKV